MMRKKLPARPSNGGAETDGKAALACNRSGSRHGRAAWRFRVGRPCPCPGSGHRPVSHLASRCVREIEIPEINAEEAGELARHSRLAGRLPRRRPRIQPGARRYPDHPAAPPRRPPFPAAVERPPRHRALCRPDPRNQLVVGPHRARLHAAVRPAEPAPERAARSLRRSRPPPPSQQAQPAAAAPSARAPRRTPAAAVGAAPPPSPTPETAAAEPPSGDGKQVTVQAGDSAGKIAAANKPASVSLDQMLVALLRANPDAFIGGNVNRLKAGAVLDVPTDRASRPRAPGEAKPDDHCPEPRLQRIPPSPGRGPACHRHRRSRPPGLGQGRRPRSKRRRLSPPRPTSSRCPRAPSKARPTEDKIASERAAQEAATRVAELNKNISDLNKLGTRHRSGAHACQQRERRQARRDRADRVRRRGQACYSAAAMVAALRLAGRS